MGNLLDIQYNDAYTERIILCFTGYPLSIHYNSNLRTTGSQMAKLSKTWMCAAVAQMGGTNERRADRAAISKGLVSAYKDFYGVD